MVWIRSCWLVSLALTVGASACDPPLGPDAAPPAARADTERAAAFEAHLRRAEARANAGQYDVAAVALDAADALAPHSLAVQRARQRTLLRRAATHPETLTAAEEAALSYAIEVLADEPALTATRLTVEGQRLAAAGDRDAARARFDGAIALAPRDVTPRLARARLVAALGDGPAAIAAAEAAAGAAPDDVEALNLLAAAYLAAGRIADAEAPLQRALTLGDNAATRVNLADAALRQGLPAEAATHLQRAVALAPRDPQPLRQLAALLHTLGRTSEAMTALRQVLALGPDAWAAFTLGVLYQERGDQAEAALLFERALEADSGAAAAAYHLAVAREQLGDAAGTRAALERYAALSADLPAEAERRKQALATLAGGTATPPTPDVPAPPHETPPGP